MTCREFLPEDIEKARKVLEKTLNQQASPQSFPKPTTTEQSIMNILTSKRIAAVIAIFLCITLYFGLLENVFTKKVDTLIVYTQEDSEYIHGYINCTEYNAYGDKRYGLDSSKPIIPTTLHECPDKLACCMQGAKETTITVKNYIAPLLISLPISALAFIILTIKKKTQ